MSSRKSFLNKKVNSPIGSNRKYYEKKNMRVFENLCCYLVSNNDNTTLDKLITKVPEATQCLELCELLTQNKPLICAELITYLSFEDTNHLELLSNISINRMM